MPGLKTHTGEMSPAVELQRRLHEFADSGRSEREAGIADLVDYVFDVTTTGVLSEVVDPVDKPDRTIYYKPRLRPAIYDTLHTPYMVEGETIVPWTGSYAIIALGKTGTIQAVEVGFEDNQDEAAQDYGDHFLPSALHKAIARLHLSLNGTRSGVEEKVNAAYLTDLIPHRRQLHGALRLPGNDVHIVAADGCALRPEYIENLLPQTEEKLMSKNLSKISKNI